MFDRVLRFIFSFTVSVGGPLEKKEDKKIVNALSLLRQLTIVSSEHNDAKKGGLVLSFVMPLPPLLIFIFHVPVQQFRYFIPRHQFQGAFVVCVRAIYFPPFAVLSVYFCYFSCPFPLLPPSIFCICSAQVTPHFFFFEGCVPVHISSKDLLRLAAEQPAPTAAKPLCLRRNRNSGASKVFLCIVVICLWPEFHRLFQVFLSSVSHSKKMMMIF